MNVTMRRLVLAILVVVSILAVTACSYPKTSVKAVEENIGGLRLRRLRKPKHECCYPAA